ncbi:MAG: alpha-glucosidase [Candidatus Hodarchaeales archaeon]
MIKIEKKELDFVIYYKGYPLLRHSRKKPVLCLGIGSSSYKQRSGIYKIKDKLHTKILMTEMEVERETEECIELLFTNKSVQDLRLRLKLLIVEDRLEIIPECNNEEINRFWLNIQATTNENIFGCGEQFSEINLRGKKIPLWVEEQGIGRGDPKWFTFIANLVAGAGGTWYNTYFPQPTFISSENYFCHVEITSYSIFNFCRKDHHELHIWEVPSKIVIGKHNNLLEVVGCLSEYLGRQPELPEWVFDGIILGIQGGKEIVEEKLAKALDHGVPVTAVWAQDWQGSRITSFGKQLMWNWICDETLYPDLANWISELNNRGIKFLGYINPFLAIEGELYKDATRKGYVVKKSDGTDYLVKVTTFLAALLDLTNENAVKWIKTHIKEYLLKKMRLNGFMSDFGDYLPTDAILYSNERADKYHNRYPVEWAKINREAIEEAGLGDKVLFFSRAGYSGISRYSPLIWPGDQLVNWSMEDGLASVIPAGISSGVSGIGYYHFDIGGYTSLGPFKRSKEVFMRWTEVAAFTMVMRTHEGNRPDTNFQFDQDEKVLIHLARMTKIHVLLKPYLLHLSDEYQSLGLPPIRGLFLHYSDDLMTHDIKYEYLLGQDLLIAPVVKPNKNKWKVYLPDDQWIHLWSGELFKKGYHEIDSPLGCPPVFYREQSSFKELFNQLTSR